MQTYRRIVFGEPKPGGTPFAMLLANSKAGVTESAAYCNRTGPLQHDRVTDVPFTVPALGFNFTHPTSLLFVSAAPEPHDEFGIFAYHHMVLYYEGVQSAKVDPVHIQAAKLCQGIYSYPGDEPTVWDQRQETAGVAWGIKYDGSRAYVVFRGSLTLLDWLRDVTGFDPSHLLIHPSFGLMWDGFMIGMGEAWVAIKPFIKDFDEVVFTGHSLGAARADIALAFALTDKN